MKLVKISNDHYIVVDDSAQPVIGYYYDSFIKAIRSTNGAEYGEASHCWQITHSTDINNNELYYIPLSEVKEIIGEVDEVEKKAEKWYEKEGNITPTLLSKKLFFSKIEKNSYKKGYNQALEDNKEKKYTEEDMIDFAIWKSITLFDQPNPLTPRGQFELWKSLQLKTEWEVESIDGQLKLK